MAARQTAAEKLAAAKVAPEAGVESGASGLNLAGLSASAIAELGKPLDLGRVKKKPGSNMDYLAEHDVIRTANRIFGYGQWGTEVVDLTLVASAQMKNAKNEDGWYTGYRCTVCLTVAGCVPVTGVGYGDAFEKQWSAQVTTHELAVKEAESDAIKRAFKKWGDQFGLILYAKLDDRRQLQAEAEEKAAAPGNAAALAAALRENGDRPATDDEVSAVLSLATKIGSDVLHTATTALEGHRGKGYGLVSYAWLTKLSVAIGKKAEPTEPTAEGDAEGGFQAPPGVPAETEPAPVDAAAVEAAFA